jgi:dTMP kinase
MRKNNFLGKFIVFEGLDGSGKTTQAKILADRLKDSGWETLLTYEQTKGPVGRLISKTLVRKVDLPAQSLQLLFVADRVDHLTKKVVPALELGKIVVSDRYFWSTVAYGSLRLDRDWLVSLHRYCLDPDLVVFIDTSPTICLERIKKRGEERSIFESRSRLARVSKTYHWLVKKFLKRSVIIDGNGGPVEVSRIVAESVSKRLKILNLK